MGLDKYSQLKEKVTEQLRLQVKEVELLTLKTFAEKYSIQIDGVSSYDEAKKIIEETINTNRDLRNRFHEYEEVVHGYLIGNTKDLEYGVSSDFTKRMRKLGKNVKPILNALIKAVALNFLVCNAAYLGLTELGTRTFNNISNSINDIDIQYTPSDDSAISDIIDVLSNIPFIGGSIAQLSSDLTDAVLKRNQ